MTIKMAPSRGFQVLFVRPQFSLSAIKYHSKRFASTSPISSSSLVKQATSSKTQIYISRSQNPYLNLSIEHYLLQKTPEDSTILFLYTNARSIIIGRNQNPWTETNLSALKGWERGGDFKLVRRRSGGGTVMHDEGNINYSVICPTKNFHRDKHAEMVVKALTSLGVEKAKVNCRHDIVVDRIEKATGDQEASTKTYKVSGSAYKLTRLRSLHHGTCLLNTEMLGSAKKLLTSPGKQWITARGVESVPSPITNCNVANEDFESAVVSEFSKMYDAGQTATIVGEEAREIAEIAAGLKELESDEWTYDQTPQFTFTTEVPTRNKLSASELLPDDVSPLHPSSSDIPFTHEINTTPCNTPRKRSKLTLRTKVHPLLHSPPRPPHRRHLLLFLLIVGRNPDKQHLNRQAPPHNNIMGRSPVTNIPKLFFFLL